MSSTNLIRSAGHRRDWSDERPVVEHYRTGGSFSRFIVTIGIGVGATLAWQAYGNAAREMIAASYPPLAWLSPRTVLSQTAPAAGAAEQPAASSRPAEAQQIQELALSLAAMRQRLDQLSAQVSTSQDQMTRDITARVQAAERSVLDKIAPQTRPEVAAARRPGASAPQSTQLR